MATAELLSLGIYFMGMLAIGLYAYRTSTSNVSDYMLGGRQLSPAVASLSAGASDMSGWMLMGLPGAMFVAGLSVSWIALGLLIGAFMNYLLIAPRLRVYTEMADDAVTIPDFLGKRFSDESGALRMLASGVIVIFFTLYTAAGVVAGGKLFDAAMGIPYEWGLVITASVVLAYTLFGGFLAVSLTDFVQGCIMFLALVLVPIAAFDSVGSWSNASTLITAEQAGMLDPIHGLGVLGLISSLSWGLGYFGQPHIIVRFMALRSHRDAPIARRIGITWMAVAIAGSLGTGLLGLAYVRSNGVHLEDPETIFIYLSQVLFHPLVSGFLLAAILAAIMSTISSQLLVSSSSLTEDFYKRLIKPSASQRELVLVGRTSVVLVSVIAIGLALDRASNILSLVSHAWAGFGAAFGPVILLSLYWSRMNLAGALAGMISGAITVLLWIYLPITLDGKVLSDVVYELVPGFTMGTLAAVIGSLMASQPSLKLRSQHYAMVQEVTG